MTLAGRIVLVTGASRGLGRAVAVACAREGAQLVLVARTRGGLEEADDAVQAAGAPPATLVTLDLKNGELVDRLGAALFERYGRLDGLVHAAAELGTLTPVAHLEPKELAGLVALNLLAAHRLIRSLDPLLRDSADDRAVFVTDAPARERRAYWGGYAATKAGLEALAQVYAAETRITAVRVNLVDPGPLATRLRAKAFPGEDPAKLPQPEDRAPAVVDLLRPECTRHGELVRLAEPAA